MVLPVSFPQISWHHSREVYSLSAEAGFVLLQAFDALLEIRYASSLRRQLCLAPDPVSPRLTTLRLIALSAGGYQISNLRYVARRSFVGNNGLKVIPFCRRVTTVRALNIWWIHTENSKRTSNLGLCRVLNWYNAVHERVGYGRCAPSYLDGSRHSKRSQSSG